MQRRKRPSWKKVALIALNVVLSLILIVILSGTIYIEVILNKVRYDPNDQPTLSDEEKEAIQNDYQGSTIDPDEPVVDPTDITWQTQPVIDTEEHIVNFLLVGQDRRPGESRARSDSMILVTVDTRKKTITMTSIMRDMYVQIPGYRDNRINVAYNLEGIELLYDTMEVNFGLRPDYFVEVDFDGFVEVIDMVGGIDIELTQDEATHLNNNEDFYGFPEESWNLKAGVNHLDGKQALSYSRVRRVDGTGDFSRTARQRNVLTALLQKATTLNLLELNKLLQAMTDLITTDMTSNQILAYAATFYPMLDNMEIVSQRIPADGTYSFAAVDGVGEVLIPDLEKNSAIIAATQE